MEILSAVLVGGVVTSMLRYSFGKQFGNRLLLIVFSIVFFFLTVLLYTTEPFTPPFQVGLFFTFVIVTVVLLSMLPPQKIDPAKRDNPVKVTAREHKNMSQAGIVFFLLSLLTGIFFLFFS